MSDEMVSEGAPAQRNPYDEGWNDGYRAAVDESREAIRFAYDDGYNAGHREGYQDAMDERLNSDNKKAPPDFAEPFGGDPEFPDGKGNY